MAAIDTAPVERPSRWYRHLYIQVLVAIVLGVIVGHLWPASSRSATPSSSWSR
jgi:aerobic C4-dicarboxylate transport protein